MLSISTNRCSTKRLYSGEEEPAFDRDYGREVYGYYGVAYPW
jgi:hypothetical protein